MKDTRQQGKIKHSLCDIVIIVMLSILTGHNEFEEMVIFAEERINILRKYIELKNGIPHKDTLKRVIAILDPNLLNLIFYNMSIFNVELFAKTVRKEWMIENNLHWHLDYTLKEDASTIIDKKVAFNLNIIRKSVLTMLKNIEFKKK